MEWLTCLKTVLSRIEDDLQGELDINTLASQVYVSPFYLQKGFQILTGYSLGEYIRNRRLYEAAQRLINTEDKIIDIAQDYGYETPESFTRAFARFHGASPSAVRKDRRHIRTFLPLNLHIEITGGNKMNFTVSPMWGFKVIGFEREFDYETAYHEIPKFWDEICEKYCNYTIYAGKAPSCPEEQAIIDNCIGEYGVCIDNLGNGKFRYLIAGKYTGGEVPEGMTLFEFPQGEWAKFSCTGPVPQTLQTLNTQIFREWLPGNPEFEMAGPYNIEWYSCDGEQTDADYRSGIWLPVRRLSDEAKERWGDSAEWKESAEKQAKRSKEENDSINEGLMEMFARFGEIRTEDPAGGKAQAAVQALQDYITQNYYACNETILQSLGQMYAGDSRMRENIDRRGGEGTAQFVADAIRARCKG